MIFGNEIDIYRRKYGYNKAVETLDLMKTELINRETNIEEIKERVGVYHEDYYKSYSIETNSVSKKTNLFINMTSLFIYYKNLCHIDIKYKIHKILNKLEEDWDKKYPLKVHDRFQYNNEINFTCVSFLHNGFTLYNTENVKKIIIKINQYKNEIYNEERKNKIVINETFISCSYKGNNSSFKLEYYDHSIPCNIILIPNSYSMNSLVKNILFTNNFIIINDKRETVYYFYVFCYKMNEVLEKYLTKRITIPKKIKIKETNEEFEFPQEFIDIVVETDYEKSRFYFDPDQYYRKQKLLDELANKFNYNRKIKKSIFKKNPNTVFKNYNFKNYLYFNYYL